MSKILESKSIDGSQIILCMTSILKNKLLIFPNFYFLPRLKKSVAKETVDIDPTILHSALFKPLTEQAAPVSFTVHMWQFCGFAGVLQLE